MPDTRFTCFLVLELLRLHFSLYLRGTFVSVKMFSGLKTSAFSSIIYRGMLFSRSSPAVQAFFREAL